MQVKKIKANGSLFKYDPLANELVLALGLQFHYNYETSLWEVNQDLYGEPSLVLMNNVVIDQAAGQLSFKARYQGKEQQFEITAAYEPEKIMINFFAQLHHQEKPAVGEDLDTMELSFEKGELEFIRMYKHSRSFEILGSLNIKYEKGEFFLIKQRPWRKFSLKNVEMNNGAILSRSADEEFVYRLDAQPLIFNMVKQLLESVP
jgi:hypothetical protein